jgi:glycosyltransferase involved in cell wall biosynthesis
LQIEANSNPDVSVVMPVKNSANNLGRAIESVLNQTFSNLELIIVYDLSDDQTLSIAMKYAATDSRIRIVKNNKLYGISFSRNLGIVLSKAPFIATMDSDDISLKDRIASQFSFLKENKHIGVVGSAIILIDEAGRMIGVRAYPEKDCSIRRTMFKHSPFAHPTTMIRKSAIVKAGFYTNDLSTSEDIELYFRIGKFAQFANLRIPLLKYRVYTNSSSNKQLRRTIYSTIRIRLLAAMEPDYYRVTARDIFINMFSLFLILLPRRVTLKVFNLLRNEFYQL